MKEPTVSDLKTLRDGGYRNPEWIELRAELQALAALFPKGDQEP